jgi:hypothetical protein
METDSSPHEPSTNRLLPNPSARFTCKYMQSINSIERATTCGDAAALRMQLHSLDRRDQCCEFVAFE